MRTDPINDTWLFFAGQWGDETAIGMWRWLIVALFVGLLVGSVAIAIREWAADPAQRNARNVTLWIIRVLVGGMWFVNTLWKLPFLSDENGLHYWTDQETSNAAYAVIGHFIEDVLLPTPTFYVLDIVVFFTELAFAISLILGVGVRIVGVIGIVFVAQLWLGLYRHPNEWPWTYVFLMFLMAIFAVDAAGRSLGLDGWARRRFVDGRPSSRLVRAIT